MRKYFGYKLSAFVFILVISVLWQAAFSCQSTVINTGMHSKNNGQMDALLNTFSLTCFELTPLDISCVSTRINSSPPAQNGRLFADDIFRCIFVNEKFCILIKISKFVPNGPIDNNPALVQIMAWRRIGDKPLSEPMLARFTDAYMRHNGDMSWSVQKCCSKYVKNVFICTKDMSTGVSALTPASLHFVDALHILILGAVSIRKTVLLGMAIPMLKIRRPTGRLIFNMGIPIPGKTVFYIETGPRSSFWMKTSWYHMGAML